METFHGFVGRLLPVRNHRGLPVGEVFLLGMQLSIFLDHGIPIVLSARRFIEGLRHVYGVVRNVWRPAPSVCILCTPCEYLV